ncbi:MAG: dicarboxylate/amino acid:cation symporter [Myxococcota bacterium]
MEPKAAWYKKLHVQILIALVAGVAFGWLAGPSAVPYYDWMGELFLRLLMMVVVPLIASSMIVGVTGIGNLRGLGRIGLRTVLYYVSTSFLAIVTGLLMVNLIEPGKGADLALSKTATDISETTPSVRDLLLRLVPTNPIEAMVYANDNPKDGADILGVIFFSILFGICTLNVSAPYRERLIGFFDAVFQVMMKITGYVIRLAPFGVFALMAKVVGESGFAAFLPLAKYMLTVFLALLVHAVITLPALLALIGRYHPLRYAKHMLSALTTVFSSASSNATLPLTMTCARENAGISKRVTSFVLPLGATINMDGTALYECVAVLFIAQAYGVGLTASQQFLVVVTALLASIGAAGIPHAGLVMMSIVLQAVGLPLEGVGLIIAVDRVLDMCRSTVNVWSDSVGTAVVARLMGETPAPHGGDDGATDAVVAESSGDG